MIHDKKVLDVCRETLLTNAKQSIITMMQVCAYAMPCWMNVTERCHAPNTFGTVNMEHTIDSSLSWSER